MNCLKIMTYNMLHINESLDNKWKDRKQLISSIINRESPDIIGAQECLYTQIQDVIEMHPYFGWIGIGRQGGSHDDYVPIFYKKERFTVLEYDHFWLSDTPSTIGSILFGNTLPRMATWVKFIDKQTNNKFYVINTHLAYRSEEGRIEGSKLIRDRVKNFDLALPVFATGDFNTDIDTLPYEILTTEGPFEDTWDLAHKHINKTLGTMNDFLHEDGGDRRIDWILSHRVKEVIEIKIIDDYIDGQFPSDHFPVMINCKLNNNTDK